jgi:hypothetical protein
MMTSVAAPSTIGRLQIEQQLGAGGFATVWLARDPELDAPVAVKILAENLAAHADLRRRFIDEARLLRRVDSDHLVRVYDVGELPDGRPFFVMTFADAGNLAERIARVPPPWPTTAVLTVVDAVANGLEVLHRHGVVHRDIKPVNILLRATPEGGEQVLLGDLGIAKDLRWATGLTMPSGSSGYAAPEQESYSERIGPATDVHALAVTAGEMFGLRPPWPPTMLGAVLTRATDPAPERRTPSAAAFATQLRQVLPTMTPTTMTPTTMTPTARTPTAHPPPPPPGQALQALPGGTVMPTPVRGPEPATPPRSRWMLPTAAGAVLLLGVGTVWTVAHRPHRIAPAAGQVSVEVPPDWTGQTPVAFPGRGDTSVGVRADATNRSVSVAFDDTGTDPTAVLAQVQPPGCASVSIRGVRVGPWAGRTEHFTGCPNGSDADEVALTGGGPGGWTVWVEVRSIGGNPDLSDILGSLEVSPR